MPELLPSNILSRIRSSGRSRFTEKLIPDDSIKTIFQAKELLCKRFPNNEIPEAVKLAHTPRVTSLGSHFAYTIPDERTSYKPLLISKSALNDLQLIKDTDLSQICSGEKLYHDDKIFPYSMSYSGFQFGQFAGQLGDGRVINLFDIPDKKGMWQTLQLKGSGRTPFSRFADGKAVLRSCIREFIASESLHNIGVPCTRVIQLTSLPDTKALRNGPESCAILCRFAPSWIRIGNFDTYRARADTNSLLKLSDFCIEEVFDNGKVFSKKENDINFFDKDWFSDDKMDKPMEKLPFLENDLTPYDLLFRHIVNVNARCVAYWQTYGFVNGVLNTDNTSILGVSLDFGPFGFMDTFDPNYTSNHDDITGRYALQSQPTVLWWNLIQLGKSMALLLGSGSKDIIDAGKLSEIQEQAIIQRANKLIGLCSNEYKYRFTVIYSDLMAKRLGINLNIKNSTEEIYDSNESLEKVEQTSKIAHDFCSNVVEPLLKILKITKVDYNKFFVNLQNTDPSTISSSTNVLNDLKNGNYLSCFITQKQKDNYLSSTDENKVVENITNGEIKQLTEIFDEIIEWTQEYKKWITTYDNELSKNYNPLFIPHNWILEEVINDITLRQRDSLQNEESSLDISLLKKLQLMVSNPYDSSKWEPELHPEAEKRWTSHTGYENEVGRLNTQCSCSS
ncbi:hypothetical protein C6P45_003939 [Maudiozyma exigua]|uniref:Selenoprotein O n=1 Tax=Maudiozyma exigua TaxID=34358 RepID=A0A9P6WCK0_MAUEX|nr:hypothetical protein C6P45_003939 [Kazachstania exigua]